jgi:Ribulose-5-phosphate 4-epimerase and related epimerases and aldolases
MELNQKVAEEIGKISEVAGYLWQREWAERNAGNISLNITGLQSISAVDKEGKAFYECKMPAEASGMLIFITGTGERLRDLRFTPERAACIIAINDDATGYHIVWGGEGNPNIRPTSEFISHLAIHLFNVKEGNGHRCVLHTHPLELIAISHHKEIGKNEEMLNNALWSMLPEIRVFVPKGIFVAPYELPGSEALANLTIEGLKKRSVILWSKHGALATGEDAIKAFDYIDVANKGAKIYLMCLQAGFVPEGMSQKDMKDLEAFL